MAEEGKPGLRTDAAARTALIAAFGARALEEGEFAGLLRAACEHAAAGVGVTRAKILEPHGADALLVTAGIGWSPGVVGHATLGTHDRSPPGRAFRRRMPVDIPEIRNQDEFEHSALLRDHGVVSLLNVPIEADNVTYGVLEVDSARPRVFAADDINFLLALAHLVAAAFRRRATLAESRRQRDERDRLFDALRESEQRYRALFEQAAVGIARIALDGRLIEVNGRLCDMLGYSPAELAARNFAEITHPDDLALEQPLVARLVAREIPSYAIEKRYLTKDGEPLWVRVTSSLADSAGDEPYRISVVVDVSARRDAERALEESERRFAATVENASVGIAETALDGRYLRVNAKLSEMLGYSRDELLAMKFHDVTHPDDRGWDIELYEAQQLAGSGAYTLEKRTIRKDGSTLWVQVSASIVRDEAGVPLYGIRIIQDVTERRDAEDELRRLNETLEQRVAAEIAVRHEAEAALHQAQKMEAVGQLTGGIAHDFNNLLTVVSGNLELLRGRLAGQPRLMRMIDAAMHATARGERLTGQLLAFSRRQQLRPETIDVNALIRGFGTLLRRAVGETVRIETHLAEDLPLVHVDPAQLESALLNLVVNARDAMPSGGLIEIETRTVEADERLTQRIPDAAPGPWLLIAVCDNGQGMPPDVAARVFEPFFTTKDVGRGSGLGLSQVYGFVTQSGGHVTIDSEPAAGTRVRLYLPPAPQRADAALAAHDTDEPLPRGAGTVLVVEDDPDVLALAVTMLRDFGYDVLTAVDGPSALEVLAREEIDLLFSDVVMPRRMSGVDLAREARRLRSALKVLLTSGYANTVQPASEDVAFIRKPYRRRELAELLKRLIEEG